jgi:hypothetical protein
MASQVNVDVIDTVNPLLALDILGASVPTHAGTPLMTVFPPTPAGATQTGVKITAGTGAPSNGEGLDGYIYFRSDGGAGTTIYQRRGGTWTGIV